MQHSRTFGHGVHRLDGILDQIQYDLLQLNSVSQHLWQRFVQRRSDNDVVKLQVTIQEHQDFPNEFIQADWRSYLVFLFEHRPNAVDELTHRMASADDTIQRGLYFIHIRILAGKQTQAGIAVCNDGRQWLTDLMGD